MKEELLENDRAEKNADESEFDLISDIIDSLGHEEAAEEKDADEETEKTEQTPEEQEEIVFSEEDEKGPDKTPDKLKSFGSGIKNSIKSSVKIDPDTLKDMFFGSNITEKKPVGQQDTEYEEIEEDEPQILGRRKKKPLTADPKKDKLIFSAEYMITPDQAKEGYTLFYNEFVKKRNIKLTLILSAAAVAFFIMGLALIESYFNYLLAIICLTVIAMRWISSANAGREADLSADDVKNDSYKLSFYNSRILIEASQLAGDRIYHYPPVMIRFEDIDLKVIDCDGLYVLIFRKNYIYTIPADALNDKMNEIFKNHLMNILGDDYHELEIRHDGAEEEKDVKDEN